MQADQILAATDLLCLRLKKLRFGEPVTHVYNPLVYARTPHEAYLRRYGDSPKKVLMLGMNPGPWGMAQTGVPFGEIPAVREWLGIDEPVQKPKVENPKRPIEGFACTRSEVSGRRLWGLFAERFKTPDAFFQDHFVLNYCPLVFMAQTGRNITPDKLSAKETAAIQQACDEYLGTCLSTFAPEWLIGVGAYAETALKRVAEDSNYEAKLGRVLHPSPASPAANRGWSEAATGQLEALGVW
ncbi:MAG: uracil-DNA glycosylase family protein [Verrucomicrobiota bacterium]